MSKKDPLIVYALQDTREDIVPEGLDDEEIALLREEVGGNESDDAAVTVSSSKSSFFGSLTNRIKDGEEDTKR